VIVKKNWWNEDWQGISLKTHLEGQLGGLKQRVTFPFPLQCTAHVKGNNLVAHEENNHKPQSEKNIFISKVEQFIARNLLLINRTNTSRFVLLLLCLLFLLG
jgi:hypothetical protein